MGELAVVVRGLRKSYGDLEAVRGIDFTVATGEVFALLGPNGAGKTTTVEVLEGHRRRDSGEVSVLGFDPQHHRREFKQRIGIVLQETGIERFLTVEEAIELYRGYYPRPRPVDEVLELVGLQDKRRELVRRLSGGQQRRLDVAIGLAGDPELLFLDEPTTGFDPGARRNAWGMISNLKQLGKTVLLTTHYMDEAQVLADRVAIIASGRIIAEGPPKALVGEAIGGTRISFSLPPDTSLPSELAGRLSLVDETWQTETDQPERLLHELTGWALAAGTRLLNLQVTRPTLEDVYLSLTQDSGDRQPDARREAP